MIFLGLCKSKRMVEEEIVGGAGNSVRKRANSTPYDRDRQVRSRIDNEIQPAPDNPPSSGIWSALSSAGRLLAAPVRSMVRFSSLSVVIFQNILDFISGRRLVKICIDKHEFIDLLRCRCKNFRLGEGVLAWRKHKDLVSC